MPNKHVIASEETLQIKKFFMTKFTSQMPYKFATVHHLSFKTIPFPVGSSAQQVGFPTQKNKERKHCTWPRPSDRWAVGRESRRSMEWNKHQTLKKWSLFSYTHRDSAKSSILPSETFSWLLLPPGWCRVSCIVREIYDRGALLPHALDGPLLLAERTTIVLLHPERHTTVVEAVVTFSPHHHAVLLTDWFLLIFSLASQASVWNKRKHTS